MNCCSTVWIAEEECHQFYLTCAREWDYHHLKQTRCKILNYTSLWWERDARMCEWRGKAVVHSLRGAWEAGNAANVRRWQSKWRGNLSPKIAKCFVQMWKGEKEDRGHKLLKMSMIQHSSEGACEEAAVVLLPTTALPMLRNNGAHCFLPFLTFSSLYFLSFFFAFGFALSGFYLVFWFVCV